MTVIPFPRSNAKKQEGLVIEVFDENYQNLVLNKFTVTCERCFHINSFEAHSTIFKTIECYCGGCGKAMKITNPGVKSKFIPRKVK